MQISLSKEPPTKRLVRLFTWVRELPEYFVGRVIIIISVLAWIAAWVLPMALVGGDTWDLLGPIGLIWGPFIVAGLFTLGLALVTWLVHGEPTWPSDLWDEA